MAIEEAVKLNKPISQEEKDALIHKWCKKYIIRNLPARQLVNFISDPMIK